MGAEERVRAKVFISYRRDDSAPFAGRLYDRLTDVIGQENIFMDVDSISLGLDFAEVIRTAVTSCDVMLAIIGPAWATISEDGRRRLDDPDDFVRLEVETALERGIRVVPILVDGAELPEREELPTTLQPLVRRQTLRLTHDQFRLETQRLLDDLARLSTSAGSAASAPSPGPAPIVQGAALPPPQDAPSPADRRSAPTATPLVEQPKILTLSVDLAARHVIEVDNTAWRGFVKVDGETIVRKVGLGGSHPFVLDDDGTPVPGTLTLDVTWSAELKDVYLRIGDHVVYERAKF
jgi:hypothetical protein